MRVVLIPVLLLVGCNESNVPHQPMPFAFTEISTDIERTVCGSDEPSQILEVNGTGLGLFDYDNDGDLDLFVVNAAALDDFTSGPGCRLYENRCVDSTIMFVDVTENAQIDVSTWANGVAVGDVNGDGFEDLYVTCHGPNVLLMNTAEGTFVDATDSAGVGDDRWGTSAAFGDLDGDGDLDLYVCNYLEFDPGNPPPRAKYKGQSVLGGPHGMSPQHDIVYENIGDGSFQDVTTKWQFDAQQAFSLNVAIVDFTGDGLQDVFVGNDSMANALFVNTGETPTRYENIALQTGVAANGDGSMQATMGIAIADTNGNSRPDIFTTNFSSDTNTLHINEESGFFNDRTREYGLGLLSRSLLGWTCGFHDFDLDGDEDLLIVNGHVYPEASSDSIDSERAQPMLWMSRIGDRFEQVALEGETTLRTYRDRAAVFGDLDGDGDTDVVVAQRSGPVRILRNDATGRKPLIIELRGHTMGTTLHLTLDDGSVISRWEHSGGGFQSSSSTTPIFTFAQNRTPKKLEIVWGTGDRQTIDEIPVSGVFRVVQPMLRTGTD